MQKLKRNWSIVCLTVFIILILCMLEYSNTNHVINKIENKKIETIERELENLKPYLHIKHRPFNESDYILVEPASPEVFSYVMEERNKPYYGLSDSERYTVLCIVAGEAGNEPYDGKVAVANCILNGCILNNATPSEVKSIYQYSGYKDFNSFAASNPSDGAEIEQAVSQVFDDGNLLSNTVLYFYAPQYCSSSWHESQNFCFEIGGHRFFAPN